MLRFLAVRQFARATWNAARATRPDEVRRRSPCRIDGATHVVSRVVEIRCGARRSCRRYGRRIGARPFVVDCQRSADGMCDTGLQHNACSNRWKGRCAVSSWMEPVLYPVQGRQRGDLRRRCGSALIRKAKRPPGDRAGGRPFCSGAPTPRPDAARAGIMRRSLLSSTSTRWRKSPAPPPITPEDQTAPDDCE